MTTGRPSKYTEKLGNKFCSEIAIGNSLRSVCARKDMPSHPTIYTWFSIYPEFLAQYARAKDDSADSDADKIEEIAEGVLAGTYDPASARVALDAYKWTSSKKQPKKYGDTKNINVKGSLQLTDLSDEELDRKLNQLEQTAED